MPGSLVKLHPELAANRGLLAAAALGLTVGMLPGLFYSMGVFMPAWEAEFGWSRGDMSLSLTLATISMFLFGTLAGKLGDRYGAALVGPISLFGYGTILALLPYLVSDIWHLWVGYVLLAIAGVPSSAIIMIRPITAAFDARRGIAMGVALTGAGIAGFWVPQFVGIVIEAYGWRAAMTALGALPCIAAPIVWLGFRQRLEALASKDVVEHGIEFREAIRTHQFWILSLMAVGMSLGVGGLLVHVAPLLTDLGSDKVRAAEIASLLGLASVCGRIGVGFLLDRSPAPLVAVATLLLAASGAMLLYMFGLTYAPLAVMLIGLAAGAEVDLIAYLCSRYFGVCSYGAIYGWQYSVFVLGYGFSPFLVGLMRDSSGNYDSALLVSVIAILSAGLLAPLLRVPSELLLIGEAMQPDKA
jgi:predicted MFS family arabinose efflux permease